MGSPLHHEPLQSDLQEVPGDELRVGHPTQQLCCSQPVQIMQSFGTVSSLCQATHHSNVHNCRRTASLCDERAYGINGNILIMKSYVVPTELGYPLLERVGTELTFPQEDPSRATEADQHNEQCYCKQ